MSKRIFSGIQPTGIIHLGNYFGAIYNWLELQKEYDSIFSIVDLHALTVHQDPKKLNRNIYDLAKIYIASGLDPKKNIVFRQSDVKEHVELGWFLNCVTPIAELERMTQYKDKSEQHKQNVNSGLFTYPCLMAADILLYDTNVVPVGEDQLQHVELARTIAKKFNNLYGDVFILPEGKINKVSARLKGLDNPEKKMSKSATSENNYIALSDDSDLIRKKIKKAVTDSGTDIKFDPNKRPALANLMTIYHLVTGKEAPEIEKEFKGKGYGDFKSELAERVVEFVEPIQKKFNSISDKEIDSILADGAQRAKKLAEKKMEQVRKVIGL
ncbi:tryptophan--tRNA ligase [Candidatus Falkowbacteria bacterium]|jgi:tryptophanyl-tRNA synthetase|nr:tryptophan--tRNA ligase [Candidatus Falkowbacteria bacterium]MBT5503719.1 tryptophan--tRNA ligase [Candidatus Falkowbacteria bacterium]MBT6573801.1 tryptophan--tRNA ligase [Candidatus Falkowbacteria bacterium]MBT7348771.1 tryptophan--tRNA ligase [Candidatus Falkowbacteria bacterium]MBT7500561.1 tryptophan--tRNA ligase [Candidatus Falkowbacteria bacterium]